MAEAMDVSLPWPVCSLLLFVATPTEESALKAEAGRLGIDIREDSRLTDYLRRSGLEDKAWSLGSIGGETVVAVGCSRDRNRLVMGPHGRLGSAARALRYRTATGAQGIIQVGTAFGISRDFQQLGDVLVSTRLIAYDGRDVKPSPDPPYYINDYSRIEYELARPTLVERCLREKARGTFDFKIHPGAILSGAARIHCTSFRDELARSVPPSNDRIVGGEMEGVGLLAATVSRYDPIWCLVKGISDFADERRDDEIKAGRTLAASHASRFVLSSLVNDAAGREPANEENER